MPFDESRRLLVRKSLVVGLGGTGCKTVQETLRRIKERFRGRRPKFCEFLALDTTAEEVQNDGQLNVGDFAHIAGFDGNRYFEHLDRYNFLEWLPQNRFRPGEINVGAQGIPQLGRFCYLMKREGVIYPAVERKLYALNDPNLPNSLPLLDPEWDITLDRNAGIWIHLVTSLCGGTGAGCFLDAAYDLRRWCEQITGRRPRIIAHLVMPETFRRCSDSTRRHFRALAYSLLTQSCHLMDLNEQTIRYKDGSEATWGSAEMPFDFCFLLGGASETNSIDRDTWTKYIGSMISLLATERAGKMLMDQMINVYPRQEGQQETGAKYREMRIFSSYGVATGARPEGAADLAIRNAALQRFKELAHTPPHVKLFAGAGAVYESAVQDHEARVYADAQQRLNRFRDSFEKKLNQANDAQHTDTQRDFKNWLRETFQTQRNELPEAMREAAERLAPLPDAHNVNSEEIRGLLARWVDADEPVEALQGHLRELVEVLREQQLAASNLGQAIDMMRNKITNRLGANEAEIVQFAQDAMDEIEEWFRLIGQDIWYRRRTAIIDCYAQQLEDLCRRLERVGEQCQERLGAVHEHAFGAATDEEREAHIELFHVNSRMLLQQDWVKEHSQRLLKRLLSRLVTEHDPTKNFAYETEDFLREDRALQPSVSELRGALLKGVENLSVQSSQGESDLKDDRNNQLKTCYETADPYWLVEPHKTVEEVDCVVFPSDNQSYGEAFRQMVDQQVHVFPESHWEDVLVCRTQHGAALRDLRNFNQYEQAYREILQRRGKRIEENAEYLDGEMCLDVHWKVRIPPRPDVERELRDRGPLTFAFAFFGGNIRLIDNTYVWKNAAGTNPVELGKFLAKAYEKWCSTSDLIDETYVEIERADPNQLVSQAEDILDSIEGARAIADSKENEIYGRLKVAIQPELKRWRKTAELERVRRRDERAEYTSQNQFDESIPQEKRQAFMEDIREQTGLKSVDDSPEARDE